MYRNNNIDFLKVILSFFVIAAHILPNSKIANEKSFLFFQVHGLARITVPMFLIISGFYLQNKIQSFNDIKKIATRLFFIYLVWQILYFKIEYDFFKLNVISTKQFCLDLIFGIGHLWYLIAVVKAVFLLYFIRNWQNKNKIILALFLWSFGYVYQYLFEMHILGKHSFLVTIYPYIGTTRNFLFYALPYLIFGVCYNFWKNLAQKYNKIIFLFLALLVIEAYMFMQLTVFFNMLIFALPVSLLLFSIIVEKQNQITFKTPQSLSLGMYLIHFFVVFKVFQFFPENTFFTHILKLCVVIVLTFFVWFFIDKLNKKFPIFF